MCSSTDFVAMFLRKDTETSTTMAASSMILVILLYTFIQLLYGYGLNCTDSDPCNRAAKIAPSCDRTDPDCSIICSGMNSCKETMIHCQANSDSKVSTCNITCSGPYSCEQTIIECGGNDDTICNVECSGGQACREATIKCAPNSECNINCISSNEANDGVCELMHVTSNHNTITNINCNGEEACANSGIDCGSSKECNIDCYGIAACGQTFGSKGGMSIDGSLANQLQITRCLGAAPVNGDPATCAELSVNCPPYDQTTSNPRCIIPGQLFF